METRTETIASLLQDGLFDIPSYQRSYAWTEPQLTDLIEDLIYLPDDRTHFFGNIILDLQDKHFETDQSRRFPVYHVVDGQQRLTTVMILLWAAAQKDDVVAEALAADNLLHPVRERPRLLPQDQDKEFFRDSLLGDGSISPDTPSQERLQNAVAFFEDELDSLPAGVSIQDISERLRYECRVNVVELEDQSEAASIFETINDRGKPLSSLEKTKSFLMYMDDRSSNRGALQNRINDRFGSIYDELFVFSTGHKRVDDFDEDAVQRFHWGLYDGYNSNEYFDSLGTLKDRLREQYRRGEYDAVQEVIDEYTQSLREATSAFAELFHPEQRPEPVRTRLTRLLELGRLANVLSVLLAAQMEYGDNHPRKMAAIVERCETFVLRLYAIGHYRSDTGRGKLVSLAHRIDSEDMSHQAVLDQLTAITRNYVDDDRFERYLRDPDFYNTVSSRDIRYLLYHYGQNLDTKLGEDVQRDLSTILSSDFEVEHILARNLDQSYVPSNLEEVFEEHVDRLGNLTIASSYWNKSYGNLPFEDKQIAEGDRKKEYQSSTLRVQQALTQYDVFDRKVIDERTNEITDFALSEWNLNQDPETVPDPPLAYTPQISSDDVPSGDSISVEEATHESLVDVFAQAPHATWVETALNILHDLIGELDLNPDDPRIVTSTGGGDRIAVSLNNRYVQNAVFSGRLRYGLLLDRDTVESNDLHEVADSYSTFNPIYGENDDETPYFLTFYRQYDGEFSDTFREGWIRGAAAEVDRASASPYSNSHNPLVYKAAVDESYRGRILDEAFDRD